MLVPLLMPIFAGEAFAAPEATPVTATWYAQPGKMADGKWYRRYALTIAHPWLPLGTRVLLTSVQEKTRKATKSVMVTVTDRQAAWVERKHPARVVDATPAVFSRLGCSLRKGLCHVDLRVLELPNKMHRHTL